MSNPIRWQAKDIPDVEFLEQVELGIKKTGCWAMVWDLEFPALRAAPLYGNGAYMKLVRAKLAQMIKKGLMTGCPCGCRGDIELTEKGKLRLAAERERQSG